MCVGNKEGLDGIPPEVGRGHRAIRATDGLLDPGQVSILAWSHLADVGMRASELDDVLGPSELPALGDTHFLLPEPMCKFGDQLDKARGDPVVLSLSDKGLSALLVLGIDPI